MQYIFNPRRHRFPKDERRHRRTFKKPDADTQGHITSVWHPASMTICYVEIARGYPLHTKKRKKRRKRKRNRGIVESSAKGNTKSCRIEPTHAQGAQDVMKTPRAVSCPIQEFASLACQPDSRLQSVTQAWIWNAVVLCSGYRFGGAPPLQTGRWTSWRQSPAPLRVRSSRGGPSPSPRRMPKNCRLASGVTHQ